MRRETKIILAFSGLALLAHLLTNDRYGYFRDELYYIACARHLDFGYVDLAPLSAVLLWLELTLLGSSLFALRFFPALASAGIVALTGIFARALGGRPWAVALACIASLSAVIYLALGNFYSLNVYEPLLWTGCALVLVRIFNGGSPRLWLWFGVIAGVALENKHSAAFFLAALVLAMVLTPARKHFAQPWIWLGGAIAFLVALPNLVWQINHGWPTWVLLHGIAQSSKNVILSPWQFFQQQILLLNPATFPLWLGGLIWLLASSRYRLLGLAYLMALAEFILMHGKNYYLAPIYPILFGAGGLAWEQICATRRRWLKPVLAVAMLTLAALLAPIALPILPPEKLLAYMRAIHFEVPKTETSHTAALPQLYADQFGWEEMVRSVARVYDSLAPEEQKRAAIFCQNYGQTGAIDFFGPKYGLPPAISGHQNYFLWGPHDYSGQLMIILDADAGDERQQFVSVADRGPVDSSKWAMPWEQRQRILVCRELKKPLPKVWPKLREWR